VKAIKMRDTIGRKPHIVTSGKRSRRHNPSKGRIGRLGIRHAKRMTKLVSSSWKKTSVLVEGGEPRKESLGEGAL
jgi:hypothetical protein